MKKVATRLGALALALGALTAAGPISERFSPFPAFTEAKGPYETSIWQVPTPVLRAASTNDLEVVQEWNDSITRQVPVILAGTSQTRAAYDRIMESLFEWAGAEALADISGERTRSIMPRRVIGAVTSYLAVKPIADATNDIRRSTIERWIHAQGRSAQQTFGGPAQPGVDGRVLDYNNNLQAAAGTLAYETYIITGDVTLRDWAIATTREVLDEIDANGFTSEIRRENPEAAEYFAHEVMIYAVATANLAKNNGDPSLWSYRGRNAGTNPQPAIFRAGALLGEDLGGNFITKRHAEKTGRAQNPYRHSYLVTPGIGGLLIPEGWLTCWFGPFLEEYRAQSDNAGYQRLRAAQDHYRAKRVSQYNGSVPLLPSMAYPHRIKKGPLAVFGS